MILAYLILAHCDSEHIIRLTKRLSVSGDVYIHFDKNSDITMIKNGVEGIQNVYLLEKRRHCDWGGSNAIYATVDLMRAAMERCHYDRVVFLQGLDYPIKSDAYIKKFFADNMNVEFIRGCNCSKSKDKYFYGRCRHILFYSNPNIVKKTLNFITRKLDIKLRPKYVESNGKIMDMYWGAAQWALTGNCVEYIVDFYDKNKKFNKWFKYAFPADELYFVSVVMNSPYAEFTSKKGPEPEEHSLCHWRNLHYFEYNKEVRVFSDEDRELLESLDELYARKFRTEKSTSLLDYLDTFDNTGDF